MAKKKSTKGQITIYKTYITYKNWFRKNKYNNLPVPGNNKFH
jgi:hypothetical protein